MNLMKLGVVFSPKRVSHRLPGLQLAFKLCFPDFELLDSRLSTERIHHSIDRFVLYATTMRESDIPLSGDSRDGRNGYLHAVRVL
jgi:hypothetical protein